MQCTQLVAAARHPTASGTSMRVCWGGGVTSGYIFACRAASEVMLVQQLSVVWTQHAMVLSVILAAAVYRQQCNVFYVVEQHQGGGC